MKDHSMLAAQILSNQQRPDRVLLHDQHLRRRHAGRFRGSGCDVRYLDIRAQISNHRRTNTETVGIQQLLLD